jgi:hypothetical protein
MKRKVVVVLCCSLTGSNVTFSHLQYSWLKHAAYQKLMDPPLGFGIYSWTLMVCVLAYELILNPWHVKFNLQIGGECALTSQTGGLDFWLGTNPGRGRWLNWKLLRTFRTALFISFIVHIQIYISVSYYPGFQFPENQFLVYFAPLLLP